MNIYFSKPKNKMRHVGLQEIVDRCSSDNKLIIIYTQGSYAENTKYMEYQSIDEFIKDTKYHNGLKFNNKLKCFYTQDYIGGPCYYYVPTIKHDILFNL